MLCFKVLYVALCALPWGRGISFPGFGRQVAKASCSGRVALVTGGSRGLGRSIAITLAASGHHHEMSGGQATNSTAGMYSLPVSHVICVSRGLAGCVETADYINQKYPAPTGCPRPRASAFSVDVGNGPDVAGLATNLLNEFGKIDILVNNAGVTRDKLFMQMTVDDWDTVIRTNLHSVFYFTKAVAMGMIKAGFGRIVTISSVSGIGGNKGQVNYASTKAGVIGFAKSVAKELGRYNVTSNVVAPGFIRTEMTHALPVKMQTNLSSNIPLTRFGMPYEIADAVGFLASDDASYLSGSVFVVDGGLLTGMAY